jgi:hypothetical protein
MQKYTRIDLPILAIYALPRERGITDPVKRAEAEARDLAFRSADIWRRELAELDVRELWQKPLKRGCRPRGSFGWHMRITTCFDPTKQDVIHEMNTFIAEKSL